MSTATFFERQKTAQNYQRRSPATAAAAASTSVKATAIPAARWAAFFATPTAYVARLNAIPRRSWRHRPSNYSSSDHAGRLEAAIQRLVFSPRGFGPGVFLKQF